MGIELNWKQGNVYQSNKGHIMVPIGIPFGKKYFKICSDWKFLLAMFEWSDTHDYLVLSPSSSLPIDIIMELSSSQLLLKVSR